MEKFWGGFEKQAKKLTSDERNAIPSGEFAEPKERKYPIEDKAHARNALARVAQHGTPAEKATVERKVHEKYPDIGEKSAFARGFYKRAEDVSKEELREELKKHEERETPEQEAAESKKEQDIERRAGVEK